MRALLATLDAEIAAGRLVVRADRDLHADVGLRERLAALLGSYATPWLRLGLEVIFGANGVLMQVCQEKSRNKVRTFFRCLCPLSFRT